MSPSTRLTSIDSTPNATTHQKLFLVVRVSIFAENRLLQKEHETRKVEQEPEEKSAHANGKGNPRVKGVENARLLIDDVARRCTMSRVENGA